MVRICNSCGDVRRVSSGSRHHHHRRAGAGSAARSAQDQRREQRQHQPGQFDFYVLALSWSPIVLPGQRRARPRSRASNAARGPIPSSCMACGRNTSAASRAAARCRRRGSTANIMSSMLDLMPAPRLVYQPVGRARHLQRPRRPGLFRSGAQGAQRGENSRTAMRRSRRRSRSIPTRSRRPSSRPIPACRAAAVAVTCDSTRLSEVRICMSKDLKFRDCAEIDRRACRRDELIMPPVRGGELIRRTSLSGLTASPGIAR